MSESSRLSPDRAPLAEVVLRTVSRVVLAPDGQWHADAPFCGAILPGAFHPLHEGHRQLLAAAMDLLGVPGAFEISLVHPDKGILAYSQLLERVGQFSGWATLLLSQAAFYHEKALLYPGSTFVVGYDKAARILDPSYYGGDAGLRASLDIMRAAGTRFLVAGRLHHGHFCTCADLPIPSDMEDMFLALPESSFRVDRSSSEIRERMRWQR